MNNILNYGWVCPKCGSVYSPTTPMCQYCYRSGNAYDYAPKTNVPEREITWATNTLSGIADLANSAITGSDITSNTITIDTSCSIENKKND